VKLAVSWIDLCFLAPGTSVQKWDSLCGSEYRNCSVFVALCWPYPTPKETEQIQVEVCWVRPRLESSPPWTRLLETRNRTDVRQDNCIASCGVRNLLVLACESACCCFAATFCVSLFWYPFGMMYRASYFNILYARSVWMTGVCFFTASMWVTCLAVAGHK